MRIIRIVVGATRNIIIRLYLGVCEVDKVEDTGVICSSLTSSSL